MSIEAVYASALPGKENVIIHALVVDIAGHEPIRFCDGFKDRMLGIDGVMYEFKCGSIEVSLPSLDTSGQQTLKFGVPNITGAIRKHVQDAVNSGQTVYLTYVDYLAGDVTDPIRQPVIMPVTGASIEGITAVFQGSYKDLLNLAFGDRNRYTSETAPGLRFSS